MDAPGRSARRGPGNIDRHDRLPFVTPGVARRLLPIGVVFLAMGLGSAIAMPFLSFFLSTAVGAGPVRLSVYLIVVPLAAAAVATVIGRLSDRRPARRRIMLVAGTAGLVHALVFAVVRDYGLLLATALSLGAVASVLFPQAFAYAREIMQRDDPARAAMAVSSLRTVFAVAYIAGPPVGALLLGAGGFGVVFGAAAASYAVCVAVVLLLRRESPPGAAGSAGPPPPVTPDASRAALWLTFAGFAALQCAAAVGVQSTALFVTRDLQGGVRDAGLILGLCAAIEIPLMLGFGALSTRVPLIRLIVAGAACGVVYYGLAAVAGQSWQLAVLQVCNAVFIASWNGLGIAYVQDMLPRQPGRATTVFTNTYPIGSMLAGPLLGLGEHTGFRYAFAAAAVLCLAGLGLLMSGRAGAAGLSRRATRAGTS